MEPFSGHNQFFFTKYFVRTGNLRYLGGKKNISLSQNWPNIGGENCTVLGLRLMHRLAMSHTVFFPISPVCTRGVTLTTGFFFFFLICADQTVQKKSRIRQGQGKLLRSTGKHSTKVNRAFGPARCFSIVNPRGPIIQLRVVLQNCCQLSARVLL